MKKIQLILFFLAVFSLNAYSQSGVVTQSGEVRFDGLYQTETDTVAKYRSFLRFYSDSTVISVTSTGEAKDVIKWLKKPYDDQGTYEIRNNIIRFSTTSSYGTVVYTGVINDDYKLILKTKSLINGNESEQTFYFIKIAKIKR